VDECTNVVLFLLHTPGGQTTPTRARMDQKNRQFSPYVLPIYQGSTVEFVNGDSIFHSVYSQSDCRPFHLPEYPQGESREITFPQPGVLELFCAIHPEMNAYIMVMDSGYFTTPQADHQFRLDQVPPGKHVLKAWHPRLPAVTQVIDVPARGSVHVEMTL
jgi:plastocyanin